MTEMRYLAGALIFIFSDSAAYREAFFMLLFLSQEWDFIFLFGA